MTYLTVEVLFSSWFSKAFSYGPANVQLEGTSLQDGPPELAASNGSVFRRQTHGLGLT